MSDKLDSSPPAIINRPVVPRSTQEAERLIRLPWMPPPPVEPAKLCRLSSNDYASIMDLILSNLTVFLLIILLLLCFGFYWLHSLILDGVQEMFDKSDVNVSIPELNKKINK